MPELLFALFYVAAVVAYLRYMQHQSRLAYGASLVLFVASLLSKEAAVTLPAILFLAGVLFGPLPGSLTQRLTAAVRSTLPHVLILVAYLFFAIGYLQIQEFSISSLFDPDQTPNEGDYTMVLNRGVLRNADMALSWAFNIPRGRWGEWQSLSPKMVLYLKGFRVLVFALAAAALFRPDRTFVLFGIAWFWITLIPALPLIAHFIPYYLFLPVAGFAVAVGVVLTHLHDWLKRRHPSVAMMAVPLVLCGLLVVTNRSIQGDIRHNDLLGGSSTLASNTLNDLKSMHPILPAGITIFFADARLPLGWHHNSGGLIKMAYDTDRISTLYESQGHRPLPGQDNVLVFEVHNGRLVDVTSRFQSQRAR
jgi:hypothetical protein